MTNAQTVHVADREFAVTADGSVYRVMHHRRGRPQWVCATMPECQAVKIVMERKGARRPEGAPNRQGRGLDLDPVVSPDLGPALPTMQNR